MVNDSQAQGVCEEMFFSFDILLPSGLGAVVGSIFTIIFQEIIRYLRRPRLRIRYDGAKAEYCVKTPERLRNPLTGEIIGETESIWPRVKMINSGPSIARNCQIVISKVWRQDPDGSTYRIDDQDSLPLQWSLRNRMTVIDLPTGINQFADICSTRREEFRIVRKDGGEWEMIVQDVSKGLKPEAPNFPFRLEKAWEGAGSFELEVVVTADDAKPKRKSIRFYWGGNWDTLRTL